MFGTISSRLAGLRARYAEPHRAYHTQAHVDAMLAGLAELGPAVLNPAAAELAIWYHDAIYHPGLADNEARSAALLRADMAGLADPAMLDRAEMLVKLTADHSLPASVPPDLIADAALFLDLDLAVLGSAPAEYDAYERGIAAEFEPVYGRERFAAGRTAFLSGMLKRPRLFLAPPFQDRLDAPSRGNIRRALQRLALP